MNKHASDASVFDPAGEAAEAQVTEGRVISHEAVRRWLLSWGKADELPPPKCGE